MNFKINKMISYIKKNWKIITICILLLILIFYNISNSLLNNALDKSVLDLSKAKNELVVLKNKEKELYSSVNGYIISLKDLKKENKDLYNEVKKYKSNPLVITKVVNKIELDTVYLDNNVIKDKNTFKSNWSYNKKFTESANIKLNGYSSITIDTNLNVIDNKSELYNLTINSKLFVGINEKDNKLEIYARSDNPLFNIVSLEGNIIDPKKSEMLKKIYKPHKISLGLNAGYGYSIGYNKLTPYIGIGLSYRLIQF